MRILITGAAGFQGSYLLKHLKDKGHEVIGIDNFSHPCAQDVPVEYCDIRYIRDLTKFFINCDVVYHLAAQISVDRSIQNPEDTINTNILGTQNVLELARAFGVKVIYASTSEVYGTSQKDTIDETHPLDPHSPYAASKLAADRLCYAYYKTYGLDVVITRCFNVFGEYQTADSYGGVISKFTTSALKNEPLVIYGDGTQERDYIYISDFLQAYELAIGFPLGTVVNFGAGKTVKIIDLATSIKEITGSSSEIQHIAPRKGEVQRLCADITKAKSLGFRPRTNFWKDIARYIEWLKM